MAGYDYQIIIMGTGPAGLQAAIHAARKKVSVLVLGRRPRSSLFKAHVENFCCMDSVSGEDLLRTGLEQAKSFGAEFLDEDVTKLEMDGGDFLVTAEGGRVLKTGAVILAMGISRHKLGVPGEKELLGKGVSYCVDCDAGFFRGEKVAVVGGASAAVSGALTLLFFASEVHLICRELEVSEALAEQLRDSAIVLHEGAWPTRISGENAVSGLALDNGDEVEAAGVFIELGAKGAIELASTLGVELDAESFQYIVTNKQMETNQAGVFAAGDITGPPWQMAKAVGEGCVAGLKAAAYVKKK